MENNIYKYLNDILTLAKLRFSTKVRSDNPPIKIAPEAVPLTIVDANRDSKLEHMFNKL